MKNYDLPKSDGQNSKLFLNLKDKESVRGVFVGEPFAHYVKWINGKTVDSLESDPEAKIRFKCNFVTADDGPELIVKIWDFPSTVYQQLKDINEEYPLETTKLKITRNGIKTDTVYTIMPLVGPKDVLTAQQLSVINKMQWHPLGKPEVIISTSNIEVDSSNEDEIPF